jgi:hypothetical protein
MRVLNVWGARGVLAITAGLLLGGLPNTANATFVLSGWSGFADNIAGSFSDSGDGTVSFAVYANDGTTGNWATDLGISPTALGALGPVDTAAPYVYFYQVVNNSFVNSVETPLSQFWAPVQVAAAVSSAGQVTGTAFLDPATATAVSGANPNLGSTKPADSSLAENDKVVVYGGFDGDVSTSPAAFTGLGGAVSASTAAILTFNFPTGVPHSAVRFAFENPPGIPSATGSSTILFYTSTGGPNFSTGRLDDGDSTFQELPQAVPVPGALALVISGLPGVAGLGFVVRRRNRLAKA